MKVIEYGRGEAPRETEQTTRGARAGEMPGRYRPSRQPRWISLALIAAIHAAGFIALQNMGVDIDRPTSPPPLVVELLPLDPPPPETVTLPTEKVIERTPKPQHIVVPPPIVAIPTAPAAVQTIPKPEPSPPLLVKIEETRPAPSREAETIVNLNTRLLSAEPPRYPTEARRRHETGTVVLMVVVDEEGRVSAISVAETSGADRLDKAALNAVRRWRWSPMVINGRPSQVRGLVRVPFELREAL